MTQTTAESRNLLGPASFAALLALITFAVSLGGTYIYDDILILRIDERLDSISQFHRFWTESYHNGVDNLYRPLTSTSYAIQYLLHGDRPWAFHAVNWILHAGVSALVARLTQKLAGAPAAWIAGAIFAVHPIHAEAVVNIVGRAELLCAIGMLGAMVLILRSPFKPRDAAGVVGCGLLALLSKEQGMLLVPLLGVLWWAGRPAQLQAPDKACLKATFAILCILLGGYVVLREQVLGLKFWWDRNFLDWTINPLVREDAQRWLMPLVLLGRYLGLLIAPISLSPDYGATVIGWRVRWEEPWVHLGIAAVFIWITLLLIAWHRRSKAMIFCLFALAVTYGIVGNIVSLIGVNFAERLMYLPSAFFLIIISMGLARVRGGQLVSAMVIVLFAIRSITYAAKWNDALTFYTYTVEQQPKAIRLHMLLVSEHLARGERAEKRGDGEKARLEYAIAESTVAKARTVLPEYDEIFIQSAAVAIAQKDFDAADRYLDQAMEIASKNKRRSMIKPASWKAKVAEMRAATQPR